MIIDNFDQVGFYSGLPARLIRGLSFLEKLEYNSLPPGRTDLEGNALYALCYEYETRAREQGTWESHRKYADIHCLFAGEEYMGYAPLKMMQEIRPYEDEGDYTFHEGRGDFVRLTPGMFGVFFPQDVHMVAIATSSPAKVQKVVVKVLL